MKKIKRECDDFVMLAFLRVFSATIENGKKKVCCIDKEGDNLQSQQTCIGGIWIQRYWEYGPLLLDSQKYRAYAYGEDLQLSEQAFDALYLLAQKKGNPMSFDALYQAVWSIPNEPECRNTAHTDMEELIRTLSNAGKGVVWIDGKSHSGFALRIQKQAFA